MNLTDLHLITGSTAHAERKAAFLERVRKYGDALTEPAIFAQLLAQSLHESGSFEYIREIWGPTRAQIGYEGRVDLGNTQPGDGKKFLGRDFINVTGRANHRNLTQWVRQRFNVAMDFEASPELLETRRWLGIGTIWYFQTRPGLISYAAAGNIEMVTRRVNGGLNGYADRLEKYDRTALVMLGYGPTDISKFQKAAGLVVDGISGPKTRAAMHRQLTAMRDVPQVSPFAAIINAILALVMGKQNA